MKIRSLIKQIQAAGHWQYGGGTYKMDAAQRKPKGQNWQLNQPWYFVRDLVGRPTGLCFQYGDD